MKKIEAVIRHFKLDDVKNALSEQGLLHGMTIAETHGIGNQQGPAITYRGNACARPAVPRLKIEIVAPDDEAESVVTCILEAAYTGDVGDGKILVSHVDNVYRIRNGEEVKERVFSGQPSVVNSRRPRTTDDGQLTTDNWPLTANS
jgi:nitrogen regulatory protein P-II 1